MLIVSYSLINSWIRGNPDEAISTYFHLSTPVSAAVDYGLKWHDETAKYITEHKKFPKNVINASLSDPKCEVVLEVPFNEKVSLKGRLDVLDRDILYEFKTGKLKAMQWANTMQIPMYFLMAELAGIEIKHAVIIHINQHKNTTDWCIVPNTPKKREEARNFIESYSTEIYDYFEKEGLI